MLIFTLRRHFDTSYLEQHR